MKTDAPIQLTWTVYFRSPLRSVDPERDRLVGLVDANAVLDAGERALSALQPRKRFATDMQLHVGSIASTNQGTWFPGGRNLDAGIAKRDEYISGDRLYIYGRAHWGTHFNVGAEMELTRPASGHQAADDIATVTGSIALKSAAALDRIGEFSDAAWAHFVAAVSVADVLTARSEWRRTWIANHALERAIGVPQRHADRVPTVPGPRAMLHLHAAAVEVLGGFDAIERDAPAHDVIPIERVDGSRGIAVRLCRLPDELTTERLRAWRAYLRPVIDRPDPAAIDPSDPEVRRWSDDHDGRPIDALADELESSSPSA